MLIFRWLATLLFLASALSLTFYLGTGKVQYKRLSFLLFKWTVIASLAFFAVMLVGRIL